MKLIISGSRHLDEDDAYEAIKDFMLNNPKVTEIISGGCRGVDSAGELWANNIDCKLTVFEADWDEHGPAAGPIRNRQMALYADCLLLIWDGLSRGSLNMKEEMKKLNKPVWEVLIK